MVLGDPHGDLLALDMALEREAAAGTLVVSAGDNVGYADATLCSALCLALARRGILSVRGNHEEWLEEGRLLMAPAGLPAVLSPEARAWCEALPYRLRLAGPALEGRRVHVVHSLPDWDYVKATSAERLLDLEEADLVVCGHTHRPAIYEVGGARRPTVHRLDPRRASLRLELDPARRYVIDAGSLARPSSLKGGGTLHQRGTYAALDLPGQAALHSLDKGPRLRALLRRALERPPGGATPRPGGEAAAP